ncbi:DNA starvation/stationary phase protection protein Dps [Pantanalinema sp. GBBB05]|uniref:DNA starvation/stationary phase protection protein Dps n=1 Tax=Pantanalinema sp. GBBB05 TaxID=2604139 RepID=UPI001E11F284|nr:DNA starvation/stationary phase protection protein Dps [Pantanalinema sp. GBBB05]
MSSTNRSTILHPTRIDLSADIRVQVIDSLNQAVAVTTDLKSQTKQAHWNVKGMDFYQLHELFDEIAGELEEFIDLLAERVTALGGVAMGTIRMAVAASILPEYPVEILDGKDHIAALADRFAIYAKLLRDGIAQTDELGDADTADLYTEISRTVDMRLWFLEAHLQAGDMSAANSNGKPATAKTAAKTVAKTATAKTTAKKSKK